MADDQHGQLVLVQVTGRDHVGITAALSQTVATAGAELIDIEQVVVQGHLTLCLLIRVDGTPAKGEPVLKDLLFTAKQMGLELQFDLLEQQEEGTGQDFFAVTAIGDALGASQVAELTKALASHRANIVAIRRLSEGVLSSLEVIIALPEGSEEALRTTLIEQSDKHHFDVALQRDNLTRRSKRLIVMDMDSTLIQIEVIDELAKLAGVGDSVVAVTKEAMEGKLDFEASLRKRVSLLKGLDYAQVVQLSRNLPLTEGAPELLRVLKTLGYKTAVISGGFMCAAEALQATLRLDYAYANRLEVRDGKLTGALEGEIVTPQRKAELLSTIAQHESIAAEQTIAIGDGANDLLMLSRAGLGIAFHAKKRLRDAADTALSRGGLDRILYLLGLHARDVQHLMKAP
ncbi:MAG: phosphoserine phosphatase SerB [Myxococcales bacterium]|nr:MAG: phosphoserine phosphatase SerB [Myxococcales bacterium]